MRRISVLCWLAALFLPPFSSNAGKGEDEAWKECRSFIDSGDFGKFGQASHEYQNLYPGTERSAWLSFWEACIPQWQNNPPGSISELKTLLASETLKEYVELHKQIHFELIKCHYAAHSFESALEEIQRYKESFPASGFPSILFYQGMSNILLDKPTAGAEALKQFVYDYPDEPLREEAAYRLVRALHDGSQWNEIDRATNTYLEDYPHGNYLEFVSYIKMLLPLNLSQPDLYEAIKRCDTFIESFPASSFTPNAHLNRGIALFFLAEVIQQNHPQEARALESRGKNEMRTFRDLVKETQPGDPEYKRRKIEIFDSLYYEKEYVDLKTLTERLSSEHRENDPAFYSTIKFYQGLAESDLGEAFQEAAKSSLLESIQLQKDTGIYEVEVLAHACWRLLRVCEDTGDLDLACKIYEFQQTLPAHKYKPMIESYYNQNIYPKQKAADK